MRGTLSRTLILRAAIMCAFAFGFVSLRAQSSNIQVIPKPKQVNASDGRFEIGRDTRIALADTKSVEDRFAAQDLIDDLKATADLALSIGKGKPRRPIVIGRLELPSITQALRRNGVERPATLNDEGYALLVSPNEVVVAGKTTAGTFYGLQTLKQLVRGEGAGAFIPSVKIIDWPTMRWRAVSDDISRGPVPTVDYIKRQISTEGFFKLNMHSFYMEHTFASESNPLIGPAGGSLTPAEIRELVAYAQRYHVELVPEQQTFGHLHKALRLEKYAELAETPYGDVLSPQRPGTYKLIADLYKELNELFPGQFFHIGEDETFELGDGQKAGAIGTMNTTWDDDGESLFEMAWHPIVLGAAASWQEGAADIQEFDRDFDWAFFRNDGDQFVKAERALGSVDALFGGTTTDEMFWRDPFTAQFQNQVRSLAERIRTMRLTVEDARESLLKNENRARRNASAVAAMKFAAQRFDHLGRRMEVMQRFSDQYWDAYLNLGDRAKARKLRYYTGAIYNNLREMVEELSILKEDYRQQWLAENRPYWLESVLARYDQMVSIWLTKSRAMNEALQKYEASSTLPNPEEFGLGTRPVVAPQSR